MTRQIADTFKLLVPLREGALGKIWRAERIDGGGLVALAVLEHAPLREQFLSTARALQSVDSPDVVRVLDVSDSSTETWYAMELLEGRTLAERLEKGPELTVEQLTELIASILGGLADVHKAGVVHGDIEPAHVFLVDEGDKPRGKLIGFGMNRATGRSGKLASVIADRDPHLLRSIAYAAPEQVRGEAFDGRADVFSIGVVMYEAITGKLPFHGKTASELRDAIGRRTAKPLRNARKEAAGALASAIDRAMAPQLDRRFPDATAMRRSMLSSLIVAPKVAKLALPIAARGDATVDDPDDRVSSPEVRTSSPGTAAAVRISSPGAISAARLGTSATTTTPGLGEAPDISSVAVDAVVIKPVADEATTLDSAPIAGPADASAEPPQAAAAPSSGGLKIPAPAPGTPGLRGPKATLVGMPAPKAPVVAPGALKAKAAPAAAKSDVEPAAASPAPAQKKSPFAAPPVGAAKKVVSAASSPGTQPAAAMSKKRDAFGGESTDELSLDEMEQMPGAVIVPAKTASAPPDGISVPPPSIPPASVPPPRPSQRPPAADATHELSLDQVESIGPLPAPPRAPSRPAPTFSPGEVSAFPFGEPDVPLRQKRNPRTLMIGGGVAVALVLGLVLIFSGGDEEEEPEPPLTGAVAAVAAEGTEPGAASANAAQPAAEQAAPAAQPTETQPATVVAPAPEAAEERAAEQVTITLVGVPEGASVTLDGNAADGNELEVAVDGATHTIQVTAEGFRPWRWRLEPTEDAELRVQLRPAADRQPERRVRRTRNTRVRRATATTTSRTTTTRRSTGSRPRSSGFARDPGF